MYSSIDSSSVSLFHRDWDRMVVRLWRHGNPSESGLFCCRIPDSTNTTFTVCANIIDISITVQPTHQQIIRRSDALLSVTAQIAMKDKNKLVYQWQKNNETIEDGNKFLGTRTARLEIRDFRRSDQGAYQCVLNDVIVSDEAVLTLGMEYIQ